MSQEMLAAPKNVALYPEDIEYIRAYGADMGIHSFSAALRAMIRHYRKLVAANGGAGAGGDRAVAIDGGGRGNRPPASK